MASRAPVADIAAERLSRLDAEIAALETKLAGKRRGDIVFVWQDGEYRAVRYGEEQAA